MNSVNFCLHIKAMISLVSFDMVTWLHHDHTICDVQSKEVGLASGKLLTQDIM